MAQIENIATGAVYTVADTPVWVNGIWECGDQRFTDPTKTLYEVPVSYAPLTPMQFYLAFKTNERMLLKALATTGVPVGSALVSPAPTAAIPVDPVIAEFWATYQLAVQSNSTIDPNLDSIQEGLAYLAEPTAPTPAVIAAARVPQILAGIAQ